VLTKKRPAADSETVNASRVDNDRRATVLV
jgi:hypothetical protein